MRFREFEGGVVERVFRPDFPISRDIIVPLKKKIYIKKTACL